VEHDFIMATYLADRVVVYTGQPSVEATATTPQPLLAGMNQFLSHLKVTFRRDPTNCRPRINKAGSQKDAHQKSTGQFFFMDDDDAEAAKAKLPTKKA
jgi:ATP-binding cassette subfamily E protein 1